MTNQVTAGMAVILVVVMGLVAVSSDARQYDGTKANSVIAVKSVALRLMDQQPKSVSLAVAGGEIPWQFGR